MTAGSGREIELKFGIEPDQVAALCAVERLGPFVLGDAEPRVIEDTYVDSPDFGLLRRGFTLRVRRQSRVAENGARICEYLVALKNLPQPTGTRLLDRLELEGVISAPPDPGPEPPDAAIAAAPSPVLSPATSTPLSVATEELPAVIHDYLNEQNLLPEKLVPFLVLHQAKQKRIGRDGRGTAHVEFSLDEVTVYPVDTLSKGATGTECGRFVELELEAMSSKGEGLLHSLAGGEMPRQTRSAKPGGQLLDTRSLLQLDSGKLVRAIQMWAGIGQPGISDRPPFGPDAHIADALRSIWRQSLVQVLLLEAAVRADVEMEAVHQARVALRQARTAVRFLRSGMKPKLRARLLAGMQRLAQRLGDVRDLDVALHNMAIPRVEGMWPDVSRTGPAGVDKKPAIEDLDVDDLAVDVLHRRRRAFSRLLKWLDGPRHVRWVTEMVQFCRVNSSVDVETKRDEKPRRKGKKRSKGSKQTLKHAEDTGGGLPKPDEVRHVLPTILIRQFNHIRIFESYVETVADLPAEVLHALRIECKRLRYMLEFTQHLLGSSIGRFLARLRRLQEALGTLNDAYVELARLEGADSRVETRRRKTLQRDIRRIRRRLPARLEAVITAKSRRQFVLALAEL